MPGLIETDTFSTTDISASIEVASFTAPAAGWFSPSLRVDGLDTSGRQTLTVALVINDGTDDHPAERASGIKAADADTRYQRQLPAVWLAAADVLKVYLESSEAGDTSVGGSVRFADAGMPPATVDANVAEISGDATAADNLEAAADGTGYNLGGGSVVAASVTGNVGGVAGTIQNLDDLDTAQDVQHAATQGAITTVDGVVDAIKAVTDLLPDGGALTTLLGNVAAILADTDELQADDVPGLIAAIDTLIDAIKAKTDNLPASPAATGDIPSAASNATAVRGELATELGRMDVAVGTRSSHSAADVNAAVEAGQVGIDAAAAAVAADFGVPGTIDDEAATASSFVLSDDFGTDEDLYKRRGLLFSDGTYQGLVCRITAYDGPNRRVTVYPALPAAPANGTAVRVVGLLI